MALFAAFFLYSCHNRDKDGSLIKTLKAPAAVPNKKYTIQILPFTGTDSLLVRQLQKGLQSYLTGNVTIGAFRSLPDYAFYKSRRRYIADSLLVFLSLLNPDKTGKIIGITNKDISTRKGDIENWGILGLGSCPGNACVISTFRAGRQKVARAVFIQRVIVLALHELGHTYGLQHCPVASCIMKDAGGKMNLDDGNSYCNKCRNFLFQLGIVR